MPCQSIFDSLAQDAANMELMGITDYSLFMQIYDLRRGGVCPKRDSFPMYTEAQDPATGKKFVVAFGIIDYGETTVAAGWKIGSTMLAPSDYRGEFMAIWGQGKAGR